MQKITNSDILALIDELNQYLNGNVTKLGLLESIKELQNKLNSKTIVLSKCGNYEYVNMSWQYDTDKMSMTKSHGGILEM